MARYPEINGHEVSFCSIEFKVDGEVFPLIKALNYKEELEIPKAYGTSSRPLARGKGQRKFSGDVEIYRKDWNRLLVKLTNNGTIGFSEAAWDLSVAFAETALGSDEVVTDQLVGCRFHSPDFSNAEGVELATVKLQLDLMAIKYNGRYTSLR